MGPPILLLAIPVFMVAIALDAWFDRRRAVRFYRLSDTLNDLSMGVAQQVTEVFVQLALLGIYAWFYQRARLVTLHGAWDIVAGIILYDFFYYWSHRAMHEINVLWAGHAPHHQSEEYNLAVALRQGALQHVTSCFFFWPMALVGVSPLSLLVGAQISLVYQFWPHTRSVGKLHPWIEAVMNTPSHHRVHHGRNPKYLDKNHAGILIVWDRLFGTFEPEAEEPVYGTIERLRSWNPLWGQVKFLLFIAAASLRAHTFTDAVRVWFAHAGWTPQVPVIPPPPEVSRNEPTFDPPVPRRLRRYAVAGFVASLPFLGALLARPSLSPLSRIVVAAAVVLALQTSGGVLEKRSWARPLEAVRLAVVPCAAWIVAGPLGFAVGALASLLMGAWFWSLRMELQS